MLKSSLESKISKFKFWQLERSVMGTYRAGYACRCKHADAAAKHGADVGENVPKEVAGYNCVELHSTAREKYKQYSCPS